MSTFPTVQSALLGVQQSLRLYEETAQRLARSATSGNLEHVAEDLVEMKKAEAGVSVNVAVARTADEMSGTLLDLLA